MQTTFIHDLSTTDNLHPKTTIVTRGGYAGLTAAYQLAKQGRHSIILEDNVNTK